MGVDASLVAAKAHLVLSVQQTIPVLRSFGLAKAPEFYAEFPVFHVDWEHRFDANAPAYVQDPRDKCVLRLTEHHRDCCLGSSVLIAFSGMEQLHQEITSKGYSRMRLGIELAPWRAKRMAVIDSSGKCLRFNEDIS